MQTPILDSYSISPRRSKQGLQHEENILWRVLKGPKWNKNSINIHKEDSNIMKLENNMKQGNIMWMGRWGSNPQYPRKKTNSNLPRQNNSTILNSH